MPVSAIESPLTVLWRWEAKHKPHSSDLLHIGTLIAHHLLSHLEAARSELCRPHLLSAVTLPLARGFFGYRFVTYNLCDKAVLEKIIETNYTSKLTGSKSDDKSVAFAM